MRYKNDQNDKNGERIRKTIKKGGKFEIIPSQTKIELDKKKILFVITTYRPLWE